MTARRAIRIRRKARGLAEVQVRDASSCLEVEWTSGRLKRFARLVTWSGNAHSVDTRAMLGDSRVVASSVTDCALFGQKHTYWSRAGPGGGRRRCAALGSVEGQGETSDRRCPGNIVDFPAGGLSN